MTGTNQLLQRVKSLLTGLSLSRYSLASNLDHHTHNKLVSLWVNWYQQQASSPTTSRAWRAHLTTTGVSGNDPY